MTGEPERDTTTGRFTRAVTNTICHLHFPSLPFPIPYVEWVRRPACGLDLLVFVHFRLTVLSSDSDSPG